LFLIRSQVILTQTIMQQNNEFFAAKLNKLQHQHETIVIRYMRTILLSFVVLFGLASLGVDPFYIHIAEVSFTIVMLVMAIHYLHYLIAWSAKINMIWSFIQQDKEDLNQTSPVQESSHNV